MNNAKLLLKDDFKKKLNKNIWDLTKINQSCWEIIDKVPNNHSKYALKVDANNSVRSPKDKKDIDRSEISEKEHVHVKLDNSVWYLISFYFPKGFFIADNRLVFAQWKQYAPHYGSPFLSARYINNKFSFKVTGENVVKKFNKKIDLRGKWHVIIVNYKLGTNQTGFAKGWLDSELVMDYKGEMDYSPAPNYIFFKMGLYRDTLEQPQTIYFNKFRRSPTRSGLFL